MVMGSLPARGPRAVAEEGPRLIVESLENSLIIF